MVDTPPESLACGPVRLRRWRPDDLGPLVAAARESWQHLRPWLPWAQDEPGEAAQSPWLASTRDQWESGEAFQYAMLPAASDVLVGSIGLMRRIGLGGLEIGYWVHVEHAGRGLATHAAAALTQAGLALSDVDHLEIHCDRENAASAAVAARLGYTVAELREVAPAAAGETGRHQIWRMDAGRWPGSGAERIWEAGRAG